MRRTRGGDRQRDDLAAGARPRDGAKRLTVAIESERDRVALDGHGADAVHRVGFREGLGEPDLRRARGRDDLFGGSDRACAADRERNHREDGSEHDGG